MIETCACVVVRCDDCGEDWYDQLDGVIHFPSIDDARRYLGDDWNIADDGAAFCPHCIAARSCLANGHDWDEFTPCRHELWAQPPAENHECRDLRSCERCGDLDSRPAAGVSVAVTESED